MNVAARLATWGRQSTSAGSAVATIGEPAFGVSHQGGEIFPKVRVQSRKQFCHGKLYEGCHVGPPKTPRDARDGCVQGFRLSVGREEIVTHSVLQELLSRRRQVRDVAVETRIGLRREDSKRLVMKRQPVTRQKVVGYQVHEDGRHSSQRGRKTRAARANGFLLIAEGIDAAMQPHPIRERLGQRLGHHAFQKIAQIPARHDTLGYVGIRQLRNEAVSEKIHEADRSAETQIALQIGVEINPVGSFDPRLFCPRGGGLLRVTRLRGGTQTVFLEVSLGRD